MYHLYKLLAVAICTCFATVSFADQRDERPVIYLTFDDGPSADGVTEQLLGVLANYGAKATFFVTGQRARKEPEKISAILYGGHAIGNHTHSHVKLTNEPESSIERQFRKANESVADAGGPPLTCFRAPFGATDHVVNRVADSMGMTSVNWSVDTRDWHPATDDYHILDSLSYLKNGDIVLMHDGPQKREKTVYVLEEWLSMSAHLYQFKALPQCVPYGTSEFFATIDEQEVDVQLEEEDIPSLLNKLRSYRFSFQIDSTEQARAVPLNSEYLASRKQY